MYLQKIITSVFICFLLFCYRNGHAKLAPDFILPCDDTSPKCLIKATADSIPGFVAGLPHLNVSVLDPLSIDKMAVSLSNLTFIFYDVKVSGFKDCVVDNVESYLDKKKFLLSFHCNLTLTSKYEANGQFLLFAINGEGDAKIKLRNYNMIIDINTKYIKDKKNKYYFGIKSYTYTFGYGDKVEFDMTNLFKGSKQLSDAVLAVLNQNWKLIIDDFGKPFVEYSIEYIFKSVKNFFLAVPYDELINVPIPV